MTEKEKYDMASVINSLGKIAFFDEISEETKAHLERNIAVLEKMAEDES